MTVELFWRIPINGDGRSVAQAGWNRGDWNPPTRRSIAPDFRDPQADHARYVDYLVQVAQAAEISGFDGVLVPSAWNSEEPWIVSTILAQQTRSLRLMPA